jgi:hypothetical protein
MRAARVQVTLSDEDMCCLHWEAERKGLAPATLAGSHIHQQLLSSLNSREFRRFWKAQHDPAYEDAITEDHLEAVVQ